MKKRDALKSYINPTSDLAQLRDAVSADLDLVSDAYSATQTTLVELEKALSRIDSIAVQEGSLAAVRAFRDIAAAQRDIAGTLIALRAEGRLTIRERLAQSTPPSPASSMVETGLSPSPKISSPPASPDRIDNNPVSPGFDSDSPSARIDYSENTPISNFIADMARAAPDGAAAALPLAEFLKRSTK